MSLHSSNSGSDDASIVRPSVPGLDRATRWFPLTAVAYFILARVGLHLSVPAGYAGSIWPAAGLALFATLRWGQGAVPAIWLGSTLASWSFFGKWSLQGVDSMMVIGLAGALQASLGGVLVSRWGGDRALLRGRDAFRLLLLGGPLACVASASIAVSYLAYQGMVPDALRVVQWVTWWAGDSVGVLLFTPALLALGRGARHWRLVAAMTWIPLGLLLVVHNQLFTRQHRQLETTFRSDAQDSIRLVMSAVEAPMERLYRIHAHFESGGVPSASRFGEFATKALADAPSWRAVSWNPLATAEERERCEHRLQERFPGRRIRERGPGGQLVLAAERSEYIYVDYIVPLEGNEAAVGYDVASNPQRREALDRARRTGELSVTSPIALVQDDSTAGLGILAFLPFAPKAEEPAGFITGVLSMYEVVAPARATGLELSITDVVGAPMSLYGTAPVSSEASQGLLPAFVKSTSIGGRRWELHIAATPHYVSQRVASPTMAFHSLGVAAAFMIGVFALYFSGRASVLEQQVFRRTRELATSEEQYRHLVSAAGASHPSGLG